MAHATGAIHFEPEGLDVDSLIAHLVHACGLARGLRLRDEPDLDPAPHLLHVRLWDAEQQVSE